MSESIKTAEPFEVNDVKNLEAHYGPETPFVVDFLSDMNEFGMPGAVILPTSLEVVPRSVWGKLLGSHDKTVPGSLVECYLVGVVTAPKGGNEYAHLVFLDGAGTHWLLEGATAHNPAGFTGIATELGSTPFFTGDFYEHDEQLPESSRYYMHSGTKFCEKPIKIVLEDTRNINREIEPDTYR